MPLANSRSAPGARSCTISSMAVPSSPVPANPVGTGTVAGSSPFWIEAARLSTPSEITPTRTPAPVEPELAAHLVRERGDVARDWSLASHRARPGRIDRTPSTAATARTPPAGTQPSTSPLSRVLALDREPGGLEGVAGRGVEIADVHLDPDPAVAPPSRRSPGAVAERAAVPEAAHHAQATVELLVGLIERGLPALQLGRAVHRAAVLERRRPERRRASQQDQDEGPDGQREGGAHMVRQGTVPEIRVDRPPAARASVPAWRRSGPRPPTACCSIVLTRAREYNTITPALRDELAAAIDDGRRRPRGPRHPAARRRPRLLRRLRARLVDRGAGRGTRPSAAPGRRRARAGTRSPTGAS